MVFQTWNLESRKKKGKDSIVSLYCRCQLLDESLLLYAKIPTGSVKLECSPPERKVVFESQASHTKDLKNGN